MAELEHGPLTAEMVPLLMEGKSVWIDPKWGIVRLDHFDDSKRRAFTVGVEDEQVRLLVPKGTYLGEDIGDGWIAAPPGGWTENPVPGRRVDARFRDGLTTTLPRFSEEWDWTHNSPDRKISKGQDDLVAFRLAHTPKHEATDAMGMESQRDEGLKPCPFCGGPARLMDMTERAKARGYQYVHCTACGIDAGSVEAWNRRATTQPAEQSASSPVEGEVIAAARELLDACYTADANSDLSDFIDGTLLTRLDKALTTRSVAVSSEAVARGGQWNAHTGEDYAVVMLPDETTDTASIHVYSEDEDLPQRIADALNQARKPEGAEPVAWRWRASRNHPLFRDDAKADALPWKVSYGRPPNLNEPGLQTEWFDVQPLYAHPAHEAGEVERLRRALEATIPFVAIHVTRWAKEAGYPDGHLHPTHYDILKNTGAPMDQFVRAESQGAQQ